MESKSIEVSKSFIDATKEVFVGALREAKLKYLIPIIFFIVGTLVIMLIAAYFSPAIAFIIMMLLFAAYVFGIKDRYD